MIKPNIINHAKDTIEKFDYFRANPQLIKPWFAELQKIHPHKTLSQILELVQDEEVAWNDCLDSAENSRTIVFSGEQANVFMDIAATYRSPLEYRLPFSDVIIQFTKPLPVQILSPTSWAATDDKIIGLVLSQRITDQSRVDQMLGIKDDLKSNPFAMLRVSSDAMKLGSAVNGCIVIYEDYEILRIGWVSDSENEILDEESDNIKQSNSDYVQKIIQLKRRIKNLAICCIGYINCENIYLHQEGGAPEKVNRKREAKGKSRLEPYYVCRIRGVNYDSVATGTGSAHHIRYDVRGHFRRLTTGKTTWIRPHQRGLQNELYIPKTYKVDKGSKPAWQSEATNG